MRRAVFLLLLCAPLAVCAAERCKFEAPRQLDANLTGVKTVQINVNSHDVHVTGSRGIDGLTLTGRACASDRSTLEALTVSQRREGDRLIVDVGGELHISFSFFRDSYRSLDVTVKLPPGMPLDVQVGSGEADVSGVAQLDSGVGSGELRVRDVAGKVASSVGSGAIDMERIGALELGSVGSGEATVRAIKGDARVGSIGSGEVKLSQVSGNVHADTLGSGEFSVDEVGGDFHLGAKGSGEVNQRDVKGKVSVPSDDD